MAMHGTGLDMDELWHDAPEEMEHWEQPEEATLSIHTVEGSQEMETIKMLGVHRIGNWLS